MKRALGFLLIAVVLFFSVQRLLRRPNPSELLGLWSLTDARALSDELRFYYFHKGGKGLYRYGQVGYNQTHSFDWSVEGDKLTLLFRKTGEHARTRFVLGEENGRRSLTLVEDPRGPGRTRYRLTPSSLEAEAGPLSLAQDPTSGAASIVGRMWMATQRYATGGLGFRMYQLSEHAPPGWKPGYKLGWYHLGDFDDWTTETLGYQQEPGALRLRFLLRAEEKLTPAELRPARDTRTLTLARDPRNFLHVTTLIDVGRSF